MIFSKTLGKTGKQETWSTLLHTIIRSIYTLWPLLLLVGLPFFFVGGPGFYSARSTVHLWDLGHILFFALFTLWLQRLPLWQRIKASPVQALAALFILPFLAGFTVECLQYIVNGRSPSLADILRNQLGVVIALVFQRWPHCQFRGRCCTIVFLRGLTLAFFFVALGPLCTAVWDEQQARRQFPLLAPFESPHELSRWFYWKQLQLEHQIVRHGSSSARVQLSTAKYSGITLLHFPRDWRGYRRLRFSVYNPLAGKLEINCRLDDSVHRQQRGPYADRFNTHFVLKPGWNDLSISLRQAAAAPRGRAMNMADIKGFALFVVQQKEALAIYLDHVYLE